MSPTENNLRIREIPADLETPVTAWLKLHPIGACALLESVEQAERIGRYSIIGVDPVQEITLASDNVTLRSGEEKKTIPLPPETDPLTILRDLLSKDDSAQRHGLPGIVSGAVGYLGYDYIRFLERLPDRHEDPLGFPLGRFLVTGATVLFDHVKRKILVASCQPDADDRIEKVLAALRKPADTSTLTGNGNGDPVEFTSNLSQETYEAAVRKAKEYIRAGDIFQVVLSRREEGTIRVPPLQIYRALRILNPSPYMFFLDFGEDKIIGSSPEVHARLDGPVARLRPIAGTRRRGKTPEEDLALEKELLADEKERAEHLMLIDLARNDVGRVARYGTVQCTDLFTIERYSHVMHIVSEVIGTLDKEQDQFDLLAGTFPAGTVSGAPKVRAMQIIDDLEGCRRGPYAGTVGYFSPSGDMDMCIAIRTLFLRGSRAILQAGAGIVADSDPALEWKETVNKLAGLRRAIDMAEAGL